MFRFHFLVSFLLLTVSASLGFDNATASQQAPSADASPSSTTTTPSTITTSAASSVTTAPSVNKVSYVVSDPKDHTVCIVLNGTIKFVLPYATQQGIAFVDYYLPSTGSTKDSSCVAKWMNTTGQLLKVDGFHENWYFELFFENISASASSGRFVTTKLRLHYSVTNSTMFPNATGVLPHGVNAIYDGSVANPVFQAADFPGYYVCQSDTKFTLNTTSVNASATVHFQDLSLFAFGKQNSSVGLGAKTICVADFVRSMYFVPLVVGCVLGALIVVVLIAFLIGRSRLRTGYHRV